MNAEKVRHIDLYPDEWLAGTAQMEPVDVGVYWTACALVYSHGGAFEETELKRFLKCHGLTLRAATDRLVKVGKLTRIGTKITSERCENELRKSRERIEKARENGKKGGRPTAESKDINGLEKPNGLSSEKLTTNYQPSEEDPNGSIGQITAAAEPVEEPAEASAIKPPKAPSKAQIEEEFKAAFWPACLHKVGKQDALKQYVIARKKVSMEILVEGMKLYSETIAGTDPQFWLHPERWLSKRRWTDEKPTAQTWGYGNGRQSAHAAETAAFDAVTRYPTIQ